MSADTVTITVTLDREELARAMAWVAWLGYDSVHHAMDPEWVIQSVVGNAAENAHDDRLDHSTQVTTLRYVLALRALPSLDVARRWLTTVCPECGEDQTGQDDGSHVMVGGWVAVGCEGYHVINPAVVGQGTGGWNDWTEDVG
jgi:hypothetical protein